MTLMAGGFVDIADFGDTGWVACTMESGTVETGGHEVQVRAIGDIVFLRGRMTRVTSGSTLAWATVPAGFEPDRIVEIPQRAQADVSSAPTRVYINTVGEISTSGTPASNAGININASWIRAS